MRATGGRAGRVVRESPVRVVAVVAVVALACLLAGLAVWTLLPESGEAPESGETPGANPPVEPNVTLEISGTVASDVPAEGVSVSVQADGNVLATAETAADGSYTVDAAVPADAETASLVTNGVTAAQVEVEPAVDHAMHEVDVDIASLVAAEPAVDTVADFLMEGVGNRHEPYRIETASDLQAVRSAPHREYELVADVDATHTAGWRNGSGFAPIHSFVGTLEGHGHAITGLTIDSGAESNVGLFGTLAGDVANLTLADVTVAATAADGSAGGSRVGALAGYLETPAGYSGGAGLAIANVSIVGATVDTSGDAAGGEVAALVGSIEYSGEVDITGISVTNSTVDASGDVAGDMVGAIVGNVYATTNVTIRHGSVTDTTVDAWSQQDGGTLVGGAVGYVWETEATTIADVTVTGGTVAGGVRSVGGLAGYVGRTYDTVIEDAVVAETTVRTPDGNRSHPYGYEVGGLAGYIGAGGETLGNVAVEDATVEGGTFGISGLVGRLGNTTTEIDGAIVSNTTVDASARTSDAAGHMVGGIIGGLGNSDGIAIANASVTESTLRATAGPDERAGSKIGGQVGYVWGSNETTLTNVSVSSTTVDASGGGKAATGVGGLVGSVQESAATTITAASVTDVAVAALSDGDDGATGVGGGIGAVEHSNPSVEAVMVRGVSVETGTAAGGSAVGGFAGRFNDSSGTVSRVSVTDLTVTANNDTAGLVGSIGRVAGKLTLQETYVAATTVTGDGPSALFPAHDAVVAEAAYWDVETTADGDGETIEAGQGTPLQTHALQAPDGPPGFDDATWVFSPGNYPALLALE